MDGEEKIGYRQVLRQKEFRKTILAAVINRFGDSIDSIAMTWLVYQLTQSAAWSAIIFGVNRIPTIFLQPFAGAAIEGRNNKRIMIVTDIIRGLCVCFIATGLYLGFLNKWMLLTATIIISSAEAFRGPASSALLPKLLDKKYYSFGLSLSASACSVMELIGVGAAGVIISVFSLSAAIYIDMVTFFLSAVIIMMLRVKEEKQESAGFNTREYLDSLRGGFDYLRNDKLLRYFVILAVFLNAVLVPLNSLQAPLISEVLKVNEIMLSVQGLAISIGMIIGAAGYPYISGKLTKRQIASFCAYSIGGYYLSFVIAGAFITSKVLIYALVLITSLIVGVAVAMLSTFCSVEFIRKIQGEYIARVSAIFSALTVAAIPVASFLIGILAGFIPTIALFLLAGIIDLIISFRLCQRKHFTDMDQNEMEVDTNGEEAADPATSQSVG